MEKNEHRNLEHSHFPPTTLFVRSVLHQSTLVGSADKIQVRIPVPFLRLRYTSQQQVALGFFSGLGLSAGSFWVNQPVAEYIPLMDLPRLSLTDTAFVQRAHT
jgi:hypothetical protein